ncbi:wdhd1 [Symbiodinium sp. CCMP2456]|nr:wdhd1 [Symbiodinium sp. CCMP2456]
MEQETEKEETAASVASVASIASKEAEKNGEAQGQAQGGQAQGEATAEAAEAEAAEQAVLHLAPHKGICDVLHFSADRSRLLTAGADGRLACLETKEKETSMSRSWAQKITHSLRVTAAAVSSDARMLAVAEETASGFQAWVHLLDAKGRIVQGQKPRIAGRFTLDIRHLSWHPGLPYLCIATDDGKVDIWHESKGRKQLFKAGGPGAAGGVRCACLDDKAEKIAAAFASGDLAVVDVETSKEQFRSKLWPKSVSGSERLSMAWAPDGSYLALPGEQSVRLMSRDFSKEMVQLEGGHRFSTTIASWSPSGHVLVSASAEAVAVWAHQRLHRIIRFTVEPSSIAWGGCDFIAVGTQAGHFAQLQVLVEGSADKDRTAAPVDSQADARDSQVSQETLPSAPSPTQDTSEQPEAQQGQLGVQKATEAKEAPKQQRFQPGATLKGRRRFLAWNGCGALKLMLPSSRLGMRPQGAQVEVDYHSWRDPTSVRSFKIEENVELGAIGPNLFALGSNACGNSTIAVHVASPWQQASFRCTLALDERAEALAISSSFVAIVVSPQRYLRIFTPSFVPIGVLSLAGDIVSMVAHGDLLLVVFQPRLKREPNLRFMLLNVDRKERMEAGQLPLSERSTLKWIGFSAEAQALSLDSKGVLRMLCLHGAGESFGGSWIPVAELEKLWPVQAEDGALSCVEGEPKVGPGYRFKKIPFKLPCDAPVETFLRQSLLATHRAQATLCGLLPTAGKQSKKRCANSGAALSLLRIFLESKEEELAMDVVKEFLSRESSKASELEEASAAASAAKLENLAAQLAQLAQLASAQPSAQPALKARKL